MFERFTKRARAVVSNAREKAVATTSSEIRPEHLLMALLEDEECLAVRVLEDLGAPRTTVQEALDRQRTRHIDGLDDDDAEALRAIGIDLDEVVRRVDENLGGLTGPTRSPGKVGFSRESKKVLGLALREAISLKHNYIGTEHILLALARGGGQVVRAAFGDLGLSGSDLRSAVAEAVRKAG